MFFGCDVVIDMTGTHRQECPSLLGANFAFDVRLIYFIKN